VICDNHVAGNYPAQNSNHIPDGTREQVTSQKYSNLIVVHVPATLMSIPLDFHFLATRRIWGVVASYVSRMPLTVYYHLR